MLPCVKADISLSTSTIISDSSLGIAFGITDKHKKTNLLALPAFNLRWLFVRTAT